MKFLVVLLLAVAASATNYGSYDKYYSYAPSTHSYSSGHSDYTPSHSTYSLGGLGYGSALYGSSYGDQGYGQGGWKSGGKAIYGQSTYTAPAHAEYISGGYGSGHSSALYGTGYGSGHYGSSYGHGTGYGSGHYGSSYGHGTGYGSGLYGSSYGHQGYGHSGKAVYGSGSSGLSRHSSYGGTYVSQPKRYQPASYRSSSWQRSGAHVFSSAQGPGKITFSKEVPSYSTYQRTKPAVSAVSSYSSYKKPAFSTYGVQPQIASYENVNVGHTSLFGGSQGTADQTFSSVAGPASVSFVKDTGNAGQSGHHGFSTYNAAKPIASVQRRVSEHSLVGASSLKFGSHGFTASQEAAKVSFTKEVPTAAGRSGQFKSTSFQSTHGAVKPEAGTLHRGTAGQSHGAFGTVYKTGITSFSTPRGQGQITYTKEITSATLQPGRPKVAPFAKFPGLKPEAANIDRTSGTQSHSSGSLHETKSHGFSQIHKTPEITLVKDTPISTGFSGQFENAPTQSTFGAVKPQSASDSKVPAGHTHSTGGVQKSSGHGLSSTTGPSHISFTKDFTSAGLSSDTPSLSSHHKTEGSGSLSTAHKLTFPAFETFSTSSASGFPKRAHQVSGQLHNSERSKVSALSSDFTKKPSQGELSAGYHKSSTLIRPAEIPAVSHVDDKSGVSEHTVVSGGYSGPKSKIHGQSFSIPVSGEKSVTSEKAFVLVPEYSIAGGKSSGLLTLSESDILNAGKDIHFAGPLVSSGGSDYGKSLSSKHSTGTEAGTLGHSSSAFKHTSAAIPATATYQQQQDKSSAYKHSFLVAPEHASFSSSGKVYETPIVSTLNSQRYSSAFVPTSHYGSYISDLSGAHKVHGQISNVAPLYTYTSDSYPTYTYESQPIVSPYTYSQVYSS